MKEFMISERYRLEVHWKEAIYEKDEFFRLKGCYLSGPVLREVSQLEQEDSILLDFTKHYLLIVPMYYIARLSWSGVINVGDKVFLNNAIINSEKDFKVPKLKDNDYLVVDTKGHEDEKHYNNLTYESYLLSNDGTLYNFK